MDPFAWMMKHREMPYRLYYVYNFWTRIYALDQKVIEFYENLITVQQHVKINYRTYKITDLWHNERFLEGPALEFHYLYSIETNPIFIMDPIY